MCVDAHAQPFEDVPVDDALLKTLQDSGYLMFNELPMVQWGEFRLVECETCLSVVIVFFPVGLSPLFCVRFLTNPYDQLRLFWSILRSRMTRRRSRRPRRMRTRAAARTSARLPAPCALRLFPPSPADVQAQEFRREMIYFVQNKLRPGVQVCCALER